MYSYLMEYMGDAYSFARLKAYFSMYANSETIQNQYGSESEVLIGKLSTKEEAAGKIRVFAMVDVWTQSILKPLHDFIFAFLKTLPNDGTFDQTLAVARAKEKAKLSGKSFGYDLSAATDRLPIALQIGVLAPLIGVKRAVL
jgi:hypothetical protein